MAKYRLSTKTRDGVPSDALPATITPRGLVIEEPRYEMAPALPEQVRSVQEVTAAPPRRMMRRALFIWFRIYVLERSATGKESRVNVRIPIPLPFVGLLFGRKMSRQQALKLLAAADRDDDPLQSVDRYAQSSMAFELIRVEESKRGKSETVVLGFD